MSVAWPNKSWSVVVRQHFDETLYFFRLSLSRSSLEAFKEKLANVKEHQKISGLNAFVVFGPYDIVIRVWLCSRAVESFAQQIYLQLGLDHTPDYFQVVFQKCHPSSREQEILETLDDWGAIRRIQTNLEPRLLEELVDLKMVHVPQGSRPESIKFFLTIGEGVTHVRDDKLRQVRSQIETRLRNSKAFAAWNVYSGHGICPILLEAEVPVSNYYEIGALTKDFLDDFGPDGLHSQSYLFVNHEALVRGFDLIDDRTLLEHRPKEAVVRRYCPAAYEELTSHSDEVIDFLSSNKKILLNVTKGEVDDPITNLVVNVTGSVLHRDTHLAWTHILSYCTKLEGDLRARLDSFLLSLGTDRATAMKAANITPGKHLALGDVIKLYDHATSASLQTDLAELIQIRNKAAHSANDPDDWRSAADTIIRSRDRLKSLYHKITSRAASQ